MMSWKENEVLSFYMISAYVFFLSFYFVFCFLIAYTLVNLNCF